MAHGRIERIGQALFRWRSFTPLPLLLVAVPLVWRSRGGGGAAWSAAGIGLCAAGQAPRAWVLGQVPDGTSGQNERLIATELNTSGPYARTRNPLYLGNLLITIGLCVIAHDPILPPRGRRLIAECWSKRSKRSKRNYERSANQIERRLPPVDPIPPSVEQRSIFF